MASKEVPRRIITRKALQENKDIGKDTPRLSTVVNRIYGDRVNRNRTLADNRTSSPGVTRRAKSIGPVAKTDKRSKSDTRKSVQGRTVANRRSSKIQERKQGVQSPKVTAKRHSSIGPIKNRKVTSPKGNNRSQSSKTPKISYAKNSRIPKKFIKSQSVKGSKGGKLKSPIKNTKKEALKSATPKQSVNSKETGSTHFSSEEQFKDLNLDTSNECMISKTNCVKNQVEVEANDQIPQNLNEVLKAHSGYSLWDSEIVPIKAKRSVSCKEKSKPLETDAKPTSMKVNSFERLTENANTSKEVSSRPSEKEAVKVQEMKSHEGRSTSEEEEVKRVPSNNIETDQSFAGNDNNSMLKEEDSTRILEKEPSEEEIIDSPKKSSGPAAKKSRKVQSPKKSPRKSPKKVPK